MSSDRFAFGDRIRHRKRPEWGVGSVVKTEDLPVNGQVSQRLSVRFPAVGVKALSTVHADIERVTEEPAVPAAEEDGENVVERWDRARESEWLAPVAERKIEEAMTRLPTDAVDPFRAVRDRLAFTIGLYRFDRSGRGLIDWAVAQTSLEDPLGRFNRHELEQFFDRWAQERDSHLARLLQESDVTPKLVRALLADGPAPARNAVRRFQSVR